MHYPRAIMIALLWSSCASAFTGHSFMTYRPQELNAPRASTDWKKRCAYNHASVALEYTQSFDADAISKYFFGCNGLSFSGSRVANRASQDILADYFGLPTDFQSKITFHPRVTNVIADFNGYWNLPFAHKKFNARIDVPLVRTSWDLNACETVISTGSADYPAGYMSNAIITRNNLAQGALDVLSYCKHFGDVVSPLQYGRIAPCAQKTTKAADIFTALGYTFICSERGTCGIDINLTIPTGTISTARTLFEPQIGNGHHWALGAGLNGRYDFIGDARSTWGMGICIDGIVQHLFKAGMVRSYDLKRNGPGSRYTLLEDMIGQISIAQGFSPVPGEDLLENQYITRMLYTADATTLNSKIKINVQGEITAQLKTHYKNWNFNLGYDFWARSAETLVCREKLTHKSYGVKGDAQVYGFIDIGIAVLSLPINATQSQSTLHAGQGDGNTTHNFINENADNPALMYNVSFPISQTTVQSLNNTGATSIAQVNGSNQAIVLSDADINDCSALSPRAYSNSVFGSASYTWNDVHRTHPYLMIGAQGEFAGTHDSVKTAISQWVVWIKGGVNY